MTGEVCLDGGWKLGLQSLELGFHNNPVMAESFTYKTMMHTSNFSPEVFQKS